MKRPTAYAIELDGHHLPIRIRKHTRARNMVIRYQPLAHYLTLTLPRYVSIRQGLSFVETRRGWIARQLCRRAAHIPFADGQVIPVLGKNYRLQHAGGRGVVRAEGEALLVPGDASFMARRVREWLKARAKEEITRLAMEKARQIDKTIKKISLRDTSSLWGSCNHKGHLSFSWRLILAPAAALEYLVCHEVAHLKYLNHGEKFWQTVAQLCPDYEQQRRWLRTHGHALYAYG